jgi:hypothetical protein
MKENVKVDLPVFAPFVIGAGDAVRKSLSQRLGHALCCTPVHGEFALDVDQAHAQVTNGCHFSQAEEVSSLLKRYPGIHDRF